MPTTTASTTASTAASTAAPGTGRRARARRAALLAAVILLLAAAGFAARSGTAWYAAAHDERTAFGAARDEALAAGKQAVQNLNTLDHRDTDRGIGLWLDSTTGELHTQLAEGREAFEEQIRRAGTVTTAEVLSGAVTELDERAGTARIMIALRITVRTPDAEPEQAPAVKESRMLGELSRTPEGWKLSALAQAPMGYARR
ncbi:hypothetical protein [Streptomyces sp. YIM 98790]|uniref:hypothetical protein n=1 Tax=Streptomyces sp. YIM 98790 TaxID=2689077 RepID=UPI002442B5AE|nr:hypothetical protein [Streptomyces sp. YIM 98790]